MVSKIEIKICPFSISILFLFFFLEKSLANGKLSKSNLNLSISSTNLNDSTTTLDYNRITPLPIVTSNAPFEQTFRITVLLPKDQLYVARLGARVPLSKLLELICDNKQLDHNKYEFRNPGERQRNFHFNLDLNLELNFDLNLYFNLDLDLNLNFDWITL